MRVILTNRQKDVLEHVMEGCSNKQIGKKLFVSEETVKEHISGLLKATKLKNRTQLAVWAVRIEMSSKSL
ncbi:MAG: response regulator transcription factor [Candidatus Thorarchaeota archaeon]|jgi:DNA-binding NarL/FixJ family response regulator